MSNPLPGDSPSKSRLISSVLILTPVALLLVGFLLSTSTPYSKAPTKPDPSDGASKGKLDSAKPDIDTASPSYNTTSLSIAQKIKEICLELQQEEYSPQPGDIWWPVVTSSEILSLIQDSCATGAFLNKSGNTQVASFRDKQMAIDLANRLSSIQGIEWAFWVGEASVPF